MSALGALNADVGLPSSVHAENAVLGAVQLDEEALSEAVLALKTEEFSLDSHRKIFDCICYLAEEGLHVDYITIREELSSRKELDAVGGPAYLAFLSEGIPRNFQVTAYIAIIKEKAILRDLMRMFELGFVEAGDNSTKAKDLIMQIESRMSGLSEQTTVGKFVTSGQIIQANLPIDQFMSGGSKIGTIATGFALDKWTNLLKPGQLIILAARPAMGKTALALNIAANVSIRHRQHVGIFSLEMEKESLIRRIVQSESGVPRSRYDAGLSREEIRRSNDAIESLLEAPLHIEDTAFTTMQAIRAKARKLQKEEGLDLLIIDYLGLIEPPARSENRTQEVSAMSRGLKGLAKELDIPVIALAQLNRKCEERQDKRPMLSDLRDSGSIEQDADIVAFIYREEVYSPTDAEARGKAELIIAKHRDGRVGRLDMTYVGDTTRFADRAYPSEEEHYA